MHVFVAMFQKLPQNSQKSSNVDDNFRQHIEECSWDESRYQEMHLLSTFRMKHSGQSEKQKNLCWMFPSEKTWPPDIPIGAYCTVWNRHDHRLCSYSHLKPHMITPQGCQVCTFWNVRKDSRMFWIGQSTIWATFQEVTLVCMAVVSGCHSQESS